jgi:GTP-binding protein
VEGEYMKAEFITSAASVDGLLKTNLPEIVFVGRSNVGKSSLINYITSNSKLAKTSSKPGRTRLINYFKIDDKFMLVDLPGYGYAQTGKSDKEKWQSLIETYLTNSKNIKRVFMLVDIRHKPTVQDEQMLNYLYYYQIPVTVIATKADYVKIYQKPAKINEIAQILKLGIDNIIPVSVMDNKYRKILINTIEDILSL